MNKQREGEKRAHLETEKGTQFELSMKCQTSVCICDTLHAACAPVFGLHLAKACEAKSSSDWAHTLGSSLSWCIDSGMGQAGQVTRNAKTPPDP